MSPEPTVARAELLRIVKAARRRWRMRLALHGAAIVLAAGTAAAIAGAWGVQRLAFSPGAITAFRAVLALLVAGLAVAYLVRPQLRRPTDARMALYLEEQEPSLDATLISALDPAATGSESLSPELQRRLAADAVSRAHAVDDGRRVERRRLRSATAIPALSALVLLLLVAAGPAQLRDGVLALVEPWRRAEAATPFRVDVEPGDATVPRGADLTITARLHGFASGRVDLLVRTGAGAAYDRIPMTAPADSAGFQAILFDLASPADYQVEAGGVRSRVFHVAVVELPYARKLELEYRFPAYTALPPRVVEDAGDVAALRGTLVRLRVWTTRPAPAGRIVLGDGRAFPLVAETDGTLAGTLPVDRDGIYHLELRGPDGRAVTGSPQYTIDALDDRPPTVAIEKPGRDQAVTSVEEVFVQARADDDYGVGLLELVYSVNGGPEKQVRLYAPRGDERAPLKEVSAGHTLYLEELGLRPGDLVAYYARAADKRPAAAAAGRASSDIYFLQIRPFRKDYRAADERGMPGGGGGPEDGQLSEREKQIIAATFNLVRDRAGLSAKDAQQHRTTIALAQQRLREQVRTLADRMQARGLAHADSTLAAIIALLPRAMAEMSAAEDRLRAAGDSDALPPEQRALQQLQRAEAMYRDVRVSMDDSEGGGGASPKASELADLFELEQDKLRNQYETVRRSQEDQARSELDATVDRLQDLARRQQQAAERQRQLARGRSGGAGAAAQQAQRELAQQAEEEARRLERLARENPQQPQLEESARRLRDAADAMRRAASDPSGAGAQAAQDRLDAARRLLERNRTDRLSQAAADAARRADELAQEQHRIAGEAAALGAGGATAPPADRTRRLQEREDQLGAGVQDLESSLDRLASGATASDRESARKLASAAGMIRDERLKEKIRASRGLLAQGPDAAAYGDRLQQNITANLDDLRGRLADAARAAAGAGAGKDQQGQRTLDRAAALARGMESLGERMRQSAGDASPPAAGGPRAGGLPPADARQFQAEARQRLADAQALRKELAAQGRDPRQLDDVIERLRALGTSRAYGDPAGLRQLQEAAVEGLKRLEFGLRRELRQDGRDEVLLSGSGAVPDSYRRLVEQYFKSLSQTHER